MATEGNYTEMQLVSRAAKEEDFELFYQSAYTTFGYDQSPRANVLREWGVFRSNPHALSVVVEDLDRRAGEQFVGYTEGVFVSSRFVEWAKTGEAPYLNLQIANNMPDGKSPVLTSDQIAAANSGEGICLYIAYSGWCEPPLTSEEAYFVRTFMDTAFRKIALGYNFKEVVIEVVGDGPRQRSLNAGFRMRTDYAAYYQSVPPPPLHLHPYLLSAIREEAVQDDGSLLSQVFAYSRPRFYFSIRDQALLRHAMAGASDEEIACLLDRTESNVKKRWHVIYERVDQIMPDFLPSSLTTVRGPEKRHLVLSYLRDHPEELRPHKRPRAQQ